jgi:hypothetical protein
VLSLSIGHVRSTSGGITTLATLGRNGDIFVEGSVFSRIQCSFEIDPVSNVVMFYDRSHSQTCAFHGNDATPFRYGFPRKVLVQNEINTSLGIGGSKRDLIQFGLRWHLEPAATTAKIKDRGAAAIEDNPCLALTIDETSTVLPSRRETRIHTPGPRQLAIRYVIMGRLGEGQFGVVRKVVDVDSGRLMAVKVIRGQQKEEDRSALKREVEILSRIDHVCEWALFTAMTCID